MFKKLIALLLTAVTIISTVPLFPVNTSAYALSPDTALTPHSSSLPVAMHTASASALTLTGTPPTLGVEPVSRPYYVLSNNGTLSTLVPATMVTSPSDVNSPLIITQPIDAFAALNKLVSTTVIADGDDLTYTWYLCEPGKTAFIKSSITTNTYSYKMVEAKNGRKVYCVITDKYGNSVTSDTVTLSMAEIKILKQPTDASADLNSVVSTAIVAEGEGLSYKWYACEPGKTSYYKSSLTTSTYSYRMVEAKNGRKVYCVVTDKYGNSVTSDTVTLSITGSIPLAITQQPSDASAVSGSDVSVSVSAVGDNLSYSWYVCEPNQTEFASSDVTTPTYTCVMNNAADGKKIYCIITDKYGNKVTSDTVTLSMIIPTELAITQQPTDVSAVSGSDVSVSLTAVGDELTYLWYVCEPEQSNFSASNITAPTYTCVMNNAADGKKIYCVITDKYGNKVTSDTVTLSMIISTELAITQQPSDASAVSGSDVFVSLTAVGDDLTYLWYVCEPEQSDFSASDITEPIYSCTMNDSADGRRLYCVVTDKYGNSVTSNTVTLSMIHNEISDNIPSAPGTISNILYTEFSKTNKWWDAEGNLEPVPDGKVCKHSQDIPVIGGRSYYLGYCPTPDDVPVSGAFFDADNNWIAPLYTKNITSYSYKNADGNGKKTNYADLYTFTAPEGACFFSYNLSALSNYTYRQFVSSKPILALQNTGNYTFTDGFPAYQAHKDKKLCVIGASGVTLNRSLNNVSTDPDTSVNQYIVGFQEYLVPWYKSVDSYGFAGGGWRKNADAKYTSIYEGIIEKNVDLSGYDEFLIFPSTNDTTLENLGEIDSTDVATYMGALNAMIEKIYSESPNAKIYLANVAHKGSYYTNTYTKNKLDTLNVLLEEISDYYSLQLIDLASGSGINKFNYEAGDMTFDGTHLNQEGSRLTGFYLRKEMIGF